MNAQFYSELSLRGLALVEMMNDQEMIRNNPNAWVEQGMALASTPQEFMELLVGINNVVGLLLEMITQSTGTSESVVIEALRKAILIHSNDEF